MGKSILFTTLAGLLLAVSAGLQAGEPIVFGTEIDAAAQIRASRDLAATAELKDIDTLRIPGDRHLAYYFPEAGKYLGFRVCTPPDWNGKDPLPLVMFLHGGWNDESSYLDENDRLLVVALSDINPIGYRALTDKRVNDYLKEEVMKDKKAAVIEAKLKGVNSIEAAKAKGAKVSKVDQITYASPVFISETGASEPILSGAVAATEKGQFSKAPVKGNAGVYLFKVNDRKTRPVKYDEKTFEYNEQQRLAQKVGNFMQDLFLKAHIVDNRYLFF